MALQFEGGFKLILTLVIFAPVLECVNVVGTSTLSDQLTETNIDDAFIPPNATATTATVGSFTEATEEHTMESEENVLTQEAVSFMEKVSTQETLSSTAKVLTQETVSSTVKEVITRKEEAVLPYTFRLQDSSKKFCLLAKFQASLTITYDGKDGDEVVPLVLPEDVSVSGRCGDATHNPRLRLSWDKCRLLLIFSMVSGGSSPLWALTTLSLAYNTADPIFEGAINVGNKTAESKDLQEFETPLGKSYSCPSSKIIFLFGSEYKFATIKFHDIQLQPFGVKDGNFSTGYKCNEELFVQDVNGPEEPFVQDETVPIAVGLTLAVLTLVVVLGFSIYRAYTVRKVDYNSME